MKIPFTRIPILGRFISILHRRHKIKNQNSTVYWQERYAKGFSTGSGSFGELAEFKASVLNAFVRKHNISSVIEFGCGDGNQLSLAEYPNYFGLDVSSDAIERCRERFKNDSSKRFCLLSDYKGEQAELVLSLEVIFHLVEDDLYEEHMNLLFNAASHFVIIYSSDRADNHGFEDTRVQHRKFTKWIYDHQPDWSLIGHVPNRFPYIKRKVGSFSDFFIYGRND